MEKVEGNPYADLYWNIPEKKIGRVSVVGGYAGSFRTSVKTGEFLKNKYPIEAMNLIVPDVLIGKIPDAPGVIFVGSTKAGSLLDEERIAKVMEESDFNLLMGDLSKNTETLKMVAKICEGSVKPLLVTRDGVEAALSGRPEAVLMRENIIWLVSLPQLQKMLRSVYYPKMLTMSQPLVQVAEVLHKFTLSYPCKIVTFNSGQILVAHMGKVVAVPLEKTRFSPITMWMGELAAQVAAMNLYCPGKFVEATVAGALHQ